MRVQVPAVTDYRFSNPAGKLPEMVACDHGAKITLLANGIAWDVTQETYPEPAQGEEKRPEAVVRFRIPSFKQKNTVIFPATLSHSLCVTHLPAC